jgi:hypothetical protein
MRRFLRIRWLASGAILLAGCARVATHAQPSHSRYLFVWAMEAQKPHASEAALMSGDMGAYRHEMAGGKDFLAVFDVGPDARPFGKLVATLPVGDALMAHHTNYSLPPNDVLYANDWLGNRTYVFDLHDAAHPSLLREFGSEGKYQYPHSFEYLSNGHTLATFQYSGGFNQAPGGLVELDAQGRVVRTSDAADSAADPNIRPYSLAVSEKLDRVVTSSADMMDAQPSHVAQVWRLSDLTLLATIPLPKPGGTQAISAADAIDASEPRLLADGETVVVPTFNCGLFLMRDLGGDHPTLEHVYDLGYRVCEVPAVVGPYLVITAETGHAIVSLDMQDPEHPREVSRILMKPDEYPHWISVEPGGDRLAITGFGALNTYVRFATIDRETGQLALQPDRIDFTREWPDGWKGSAIPHGAVFSRE